MTKIRHGKYFYNAEQAKGQLDDYLTQIKELENIRTFTQAWVNAQLDNHQPYFTGPPDLSGAMNTAEVHNRFIEKLSKDLWCTACRNPWPCKRITELRVLRSALRNGADLTAEYEALDDFPQAESKNTIPVIL